MQEMCMSDSAAGRAFSHGKAACGFLKRALPKYAGIRAVQAYCMLRGIEQESKWFGDLPVIIGSTAGTAVIEHP